jgi:hypothetical protein
MLHAHLPQARELGLPQSERDGLTQQRKNLASTKTRVKQSEERIDKDLQPYVSKQYWQAPSTRRSTATCRVAAHAKLGRQLHAGVCNKATCLVLRSQLCHTHGIRDMYLCHLCG